MKIVEAMMRDIDRYVLVLEDSIIEFHKLRMIEINHTIRELWCAIYRGNDIDYIEIKTEASAKATATRRSHNYRVRGIFQNFRNLMINTFMIYVVFSLTNLRHVAYVYRISTHFRANKCKTKRLQCVRQG